MVNAAEDLSLFIECRNYTNDAARAKRLFIDKAVSRGYTKREANQIADKVIKEYFTDYEIANNYKQSYILIWITATALMLLGCIAIYWGLWRLCGSCGY